MNVEKRLEKAQRRADKHRIQKMLRRATKGHGYLSTARAARVLIDRKCIKVEPIEGGAE